MNRNIYFTALILSFVLISGCRQSPTDDLPQVQMSAEYRRLLQLKDDWAELAYYREANTNLGLPAAGETRIVFMGNSITQSWSDFSPDFFVGKSYVNRGITGQTTPQMLIRFRQDVIELQPTVVVLLAGTNDIAGNTGPSTLKMIEHNLASMAEIADANGIKVILCSVLPVYDYPWRRGLEPAEKIVRLNRWIKQYAEEKGFIYLDYFTAVADERNGMQEQYAADGVHPNKAGYQVMEKLVEEAIGKALGGQEARD